jgi:hypothetical protein
LTGNRKLVFLDHTIAKEETMKAQPQKGWAIKDKRGCFRVVFPHLVPVSVYCTKLEALRACDVLAGEKTVRVVLREIAE